MTLDSDSTKHSLHKVTMVKTTPKVTPEKLFSHNKCYMGISLTNPVFQGDALESLLHWMTDRFQQCLVVVGDVLYRYNEQIFSGLDPEKAQTRAQRLGDAFIEQTKEIFQSLPNDKVKLTRWQYHLQSPEFLKSKERLNLLFESDTEFQPAVQRDAFSFIRRQAKQNRDFAVPTEKAIELSSQYLLEEIAVFSALSEQGWHVELYPGPELKVLIDIAKGKYRNVPKGLTERINVELSVGEKVEP